MAVAGDNHSTKKGYTKKYQDHTKKHQKKYRRARAHNRQIRVLQAEVDALQEEHQTLHQRIYEIELTGGPQDEAGPQGEPGPAGANGKDGVAGEKGLPGMEGLPGIHGLNGISCWDLNRDGIDDGEEDENGDGYWDALDCQGSATSSSSVPVIWSGYCNVNGISSAGDNVTYCTNTVEFNTASNHLTVDDKGNFGVDVPGFYRISAHGVSFAQSSAFVFLKVNDAVTYVGQTYAGNTVVDMNMNVLWQMNKGDSFQVQFRALLGGTAYFAGTPPNAYSKLQVEYVGPLN
jgi:hypothetical protein